MGERLFVGLFKYPHMTLLLIVGITLLVLSIKKLFDLFASDVDSVLSARRRKRELLDEALKIIRDRNERVTEELLTLTELARKQLLGRAGANEIQEVKDAFARIDRLVATFDKERHQPWVQAVVDDYRARVRGLMLRSARNSESREVLVEALEELHSKAVANLKMRRSQDGAFKVSLPVDGEGKPFRLEKPGRP